MTKTEIQVYAKLAEIESIKADIEAMKAANYARIQNNEALAYNDTDIGYEADRIESIAMDLKILADKTEFLKG